MTPARAALLAQVAACVPPASRDGDCVRVGIDGVDGAGKSVFAAELAAVLSRQGVPVVHVCVDDWHHVRVRRYARGGTSPEGFWLDSYDNARLKAEVLEPLAPGGSRRFRTRGHDLESVDRSVCRGPASLPRRKDALGAGGPRGRQHRPGCPTVAQRGARLKARARFGVGSGGCQCLVSPSSPWTTSPMCFS